MEEIVELKESLKSDGCTNFDYLGRKTYRPWLYPYGINLGECMSIYSAEFGRADCCFIDLQDMKTNLQQTIEDILEFTSVTHQNDSAYLASVMSSASSLK